MFLPALDNVRQAAVHFPAQEAQNAAHLLQRYMFAAKFFDDEDFDQIGRRIDAVAALALWDNNALFIPPLQLARGDAGQFKNIAGGEAVSQHRRPITSNIPFVKCLMRFFTYWWPVSIPQWFPAVNFRIHLVTVVTLATAWRTAVAIS